MHVVDLIVPGRWDAARWSGCLFGADPTGGHPPFFGLLFADEAVGREIFADWIGRLGPDDADELLRVSVVEGELPGQPAGYSVVVGPDAGNVARLLRGDTTGPSRHTIGVLARHLHMRPAAPGLPHLRMFRAAYEKAGCFDLLPVFGCHPGRVSPSPELAIRKRRVQFLHADRMGPDDPERAALEG